MIALCVVCAACVLYVYFRDVLRYRSNRNTMPSNFDSAYEKTQGIIKNLEKSNEETYGEKDFRGELAGALSKLFDTFTLPQYAHNEKLRERVNSLLSQIRTLKKDRTE